MTDVLESDGESKLSSSHHCVCLQLMCFVLGHEDADLLSSESIWATKPDQTSVSLVERILQLETLEVSVLDFMGQI